MLPCPIYMLVLLRFDQFTIFGGCPLAMKVSAQQLLCWEFVLRTCETILPCPIYTLMLSSDQFGVIGVCPLATKVSAQQLLCWRFVSRNCEVKIG